jgi:glucose-1-phosphate cytidylyltransferase
MQVVILCGGHGTRIRDVAEDVPKPMITIGAQPILWHIMRTYARFGFTEFILCLGYKSWIIKRYFLDYHLAHSDLTVRLGGPEQVQIHDGLVAEDWQVTLAETGADAMTGCRIKRIEKYIRGSTFLLTYGDGVADIDLRALVEFHLSHGKAVTMTAVQPLSRFGEVELAGCQVTEFMEKPLLAKGYVSGGFFVCQRRLFDRLEDDPTLVFEYAPLQGLARDGELMAYRHHGFWHPMDNSRDYNYLNALWAEGKAPWCVPGASGLRAAA